MGLVKNMLDKIPSETAKRFIKPVYFTILNRFKELSKFRQEGRLTEIGKQQEITLSSLRKRNGAEPINVVFIVLNLSIWKYDLLYEAFAAHPDFSPIVAVCPHTGLSEELRERELEQAEKHFRNKGYNVLVPYDREKLEWLDIRDLFSPGIVFFTNPHNLSFKHYLINHFGDWLSVYAPYSIFATNKPYLQFDQFFQNALWRIFYESKIHLHLAKKYARNKGANACFSGSLMYDLLHPGFRHPPKSDPWTVSSSGKVKRIIYAPHHTFNALEEYVFSTFLKNGEFVQHLAEKYVDEIHVVFKPHPLLRNKLYRYKSWGKEKTDRYFAQWDKLDNGQTATGDYVDLFLHSDAMILDSISFMTEYAFTGKPSLFLLNDQKSLNFFNDYGRKILQKLYLGFNHHQIEEFILSVVEEKDPMKTERMEFIQHNFTPPNGLSAAENLVNELNQSLKETKS